MIHKVFYKEVRTQRDEFEVNYYLETNRKSISVIYEYIGIYMYDYRKYTVSFNCYIKDEYLVLENVLRDIQKIYNSFSEVRKLSIITKYVVYVISKMYGIPVYKLVRSIVYEANGDIQELSTNAFTKSTYRLIPRFEKILS
jgi:hypothetical protein